MDYAHVSRVGTGLNDDIESAVIPEDNAKTWRFGCTGMRAKALGNASITIGLWIGNGNELAEARP